MSHNSNKWQPKTMKELYEGFSPADVEQVVTCSSCEESSCCVGDLADPELCCGCYTPDDEQDPPEDQADAE